MIYVPICKHPRDFMFTFGPISYERVEAAGECPLLVKGEPREAAGTVHGLKAEL